MILYVNRPLVEENHCDCQSSRILSCKRRFTNVGNFICVIDRPLEIAIAALAKESVLSLPVVATCALVYFTVTSLSEFGINILHMSRISWFLGNVNLNTSAAEYLSEYNDEINGDIMS